MAADDANEDDDCAESAFDSILLYLTLLIIFIVGLGLGAESTVDGFKTSMKKPQAVACGLASQFGWMPLSAFVMCKMASLDELTSIGVILVGSSPGGTTSNLFTFWSKGNVPLSITMSFCSTVAASFMLPLLIIIYIKTFSNYSIDIPWLNIFVTLVLIVIPTVIGLVVRHYNTTSKLCGMFYWEILKVLASIFGGFFLLVALIGFLVRYWTELTEAPGKLWAIAIVMEPLGCGFGYLAASLTGLPRQDRRTISLECGVQAFTFTMAVISLSFEECSERTDAILFCLIYGIMYIINSLWLIVLFRYSASQDPLEDMPVWWVSGYPKPEPWYNACQGGCAPSYEHQFDLPPTNSGGSGVELKSTVKETRV